MARRRPALDFLTPGRPGRRHFRFIRRAWIHRTLRSHSRRVPMANTASARKRVRQTLVRTERNQARKARMRTFVKKVETAISSGD